MAKQPIIVTILAGFKGDGLKNAQKQLQGLGESVNKLSSNALKAGAGLAIAKGFQLFNTVAANSITQARDLERNLAALNTVFASTAPQMRAFSEGASSVGLSQAEAAKASVFLGSVLKQSGFSIGETAIQTERLVELGADLALTYGYDVQEALLGMTALFRGEYDPIEKFGVAMKQSEINAELAAQKLDKLEGAERRLAEQQIRLNFLFERSVDAQGAFARQSGTLAVEQEKLQASINNMLQRAGTPLLGVLAELAAAMVPITEELTPTLTVVFQDLADKVKIAVKDTDGLKDALKEAALAISNIIQVASSLALIILQNARAISILIASFIAFKAVSKTIYLVTAALATYRAAAAAATTATIALSVATKANIFGAIAGAVVLLVGALASYKDVLGLVDNGEKKSLDTRQQQIARLRKVTEEERVLLGMMEDASVFQMEVYRPELARTREELRRLQLQVGAVNSTMAGFAASGMQHLKELGGTVTPFVQIEIDEDDGGDGSGEKIKDYVADFYASLKEEVAKQSARVRLETMGASEGLISSILSGEGWEKVFKRLVDRGAKEVQRLQKVFETTADGIMELAAALEAELEAIEKSYEESLTSQRTAISNLESSLDAVKESVADAGDSFAKFFEEFSVLPTTEQEIGRFEASAISSLENIKGMLDSTLASLGEDFRQSYNELLSYARQEFDILRGIQQERDKLADTRSLAESLMGDVKAATVGAANITSLFAKAQSAANKVKATDVIAETIKAGRGLKEFRVTVIRDIVEPLATAGSVVDGFRDIVTKTRLFIDNLKTLRALGLDPQLFAQLVEAGVEAGGETAQALVDGGSETIKELNGLFGELNQLGAELGEETAQVMYGAGVDLSKGIIEGIAAEQAALEQQAQILADAFELVFVTELEAAMNSALAAITARIEAAKAELQRILSEMEKAKENARKAFPEQAGGSGGKTVAEEVKEIADEVKQIADDVKKEFKKEEKSKAGSGSGGGGGGLKFMSAGFDESGARHRDELALSFPRAPLSPSMQGLLAADKKASTVINLSVNANSRTQGSQAGEAIVSSLQKYIQTSGNTQITRLLK
jgi:hypothetical protein